MTGVTRARRSGARTSGFFGPDPPSWKVWASPTSLIGFQRSVVLEHFDPYLAAAVADSAGIYTDPSGRLDRTLAYFLTVAVADARTAVAVSDALMRIHAKGQGRRADHRITLQRKQSRGAAVDPPHRLAFGAQVLRTVRARRASCLLQRRRRGTGPSAASPPSCRCANRPMCPRSRDAVRQYFADVRSRLCTSEHADRETHYLLYTPRDKVLRLWAGSRILAPAAIATLPKWMRHMGNFSQPTAVDAAVTPIARAWVRAHVCSTTLG